MKFLFLFFLVSCGIPDSDCFTKEQMKIKCVAREIKLHPNPLLLEEQKDWCSRQFYWEACYKEEALERI